MLRKKRFGGFTVAGVSQKEEKNWGMQTAMALVVGAVLCGPLIADALHWHMSVGALGVAVAIDVLLILAITVWALRRWDY